jgi:hypothetical protein
MRTLRLFALLGVAARAALPIATLAAPAHAATATATLRESYELAPTGGRRYLLVDNVTGSVVVRAADTERIELELRQTFRAKSAEALERARRETRLTVEREPGRLALVQDGPFRCDRPESNGGRRHLCRAFEEELDWEAVYDWVLTVPRTLDLEVKNVNAGRIEITGVHGRIEVANVNDAVALTDVAGTVDAATVNGPLTVSFARLPEGDLAFTSVNGEVDLAFPRGFGAELRARTLNGEVLTDFDYETLAPRPVATRDEQQEHGPRQRFEGGAIRIGRGGPRLDCQTVNGDILIRARG